MKIIIGFEEVQIETERVREREQVLVRNFGVGGVDVEKGRNIPYRATDRNSSERICLVFDNRCTIRLEFEG